MQVWPTALAIKRGFSSSRRQRNSPNGLSLSSSRKQLSEVIVGEIDFSRARVVALGERDGVSGPGIAAVVKASGGTVVFSATECFV